jgi:predicted solute-binding protein
VPERMEQLSSILERSCQFGCEHITDIVELEHERRHVSRELAHEYLTRYIHFQIGDVEWRGLETFLELAGLEETAAVLAQTALLR